MLPFLLLSLLAPSLAYRPLQDNAGPRRTSYPPVDEAAVGEALYLTQYIGNQWWT